MTLDEMKELYGKLALECIEASAKGKYTVRLWDGMDGCWCDVEADIELEAALLVWCARTHHGTKQTKFSDIDYYSIFPADTKMVFSGDFTMRGD